MSKNFKDRTGEIGINNYGSEMKIVSYRMSSDLSVEFKNGDTVKTSYQHFKSGNVTSHFDRTVCDIGYLGIGKHVVSIDGRQIKKYRTWRNMIRRCVNPKKGTESRSYCNSIIDGVWHDYQNFGDWYDNNFYEVGNEKMCLDKDILFKGNKIYSPETCVFVIDRINKLFTKSKFARGDFPIGVCMDGNSIIAQCKNSLIGESQVRLGAFQSIESAFQAYKEYKETHIKEIADLYKAEIPQNLYYAMYNYIVEVTD